MISILYEHAIILSGTSLILSSLVVESALEAETQTKSSDERIELVRRLPEAATSNGNFADNRVRVRDVEEVCDRFKVESVPKSSWTRHPKIDDVDVRQANISDLFAHDRYLTEVQVLKDRGRWPIVRVEGITCVVLIVQADVEGFRKSVAAEHLEHLSGVIVQDRIGAVNLVVRIVEVVSQTTAVGALLLLYGIASQNLPAFAHPLLYCKFNSVVMVSVKFRNVRDQVVGKANINQWKIVERSGLTGYGIY
jgi:hypothetical protein